MSCAVGSPWLQHFTARLMTLCKPRAFAVSIFESTFIKWTIGTSCLYAYLLEHLSCGHDALCISKPDSTRLTNPPQKHTVLLENFWKKVPFSSRNLVFIFTWESLHAYLVLFRMATLEEISPKVPVSFFRHPSPATCQFSSRWLNCMVSPSHSPHWIVTGEKEAKRWRGDTMNW